MALFCRRLRLEIDLQRCDIAEPVLSTGYRWMEWSPELLNRHAAVKYRCFEMEKDGQVFPSLRSAEGCQRLMDYITTNSLFVPNATWLLVCDESAQGVPTDCGTIQGLASYLESGAIQNVGIVPEHRGRGLGRALVQAALRGFQASGLTQISLEVTAANLPAVKLYQSLGFLVTKTLYRSVE
ncbi:MAG: GNAT family N-acetyltransferase [Planctomycetes bacterium]|nr:GNAT family N-acetyltransferase [Planctomycetota bacterium]